MPVVVTGASGLVGRRAVAAFGRVSPQVRAYVRRREAAEGLRALGAKVAIGHIEDVDTLEAVLSGAHTVCHLVGGLIPPAPGTPEAYERAIVGSLEAVVKAAVAAGVRRVLYLSYPGASPDASNPYLRAKGMAEAVVAGSGLEHALIRSTHIYGPGAEWLETSATQARRTPPVVIGSGRQVLAPVYVEDVAATLAAADDRDRTTTGTWGLEGPDRVTGDGWAAMLGARGRRPLHLRPGGARFLARLRGRRVPEAALEILAGDSLADAPDAAAEFGVPRTPIAVGLAASLPARGRPAGPA